MNVLSLASNRRKVARVYAFLAVAFFPLVPTGVRAQNNPAANGLSQFIDPLKSGLNLIVVFGFIAGCVMIMGGFLNARRDENWKMTVIYGIGVAGAVVLMKALFAMFGGSAAGTVNQF
jgi:hypothetical protein